MFDAGFLNHVQDFDHALFKHLLFLLL